MNLACDSEFIRALALGLVCGFAFGAACGIAYAVKQARDVMALIEKTGP